MEPERAFHEFLISRSPELRRIARHTQREFELSDVQSEAWLMIRRMHAKGRTIDVSNRRDQDILISHLYQHLVRYTDKKIRNAVRLDHWHDDAEEDFSAHPLLRKLAAGAENDPLGALLDQQYSLRHTGRILDGDHYRHSLADAYLRLLDRFGNSMREVANHLLISLSYCYRRYACALQLARNQRPIPRAGIDERHFSPRAWRPFRIRMEPRQLSLDFGEAPALFDKDPPQQTLKPGNMSSSLSGQ